MKLGPIRREISWLRISSFLRVVDGRNCSILPFWNKARTEGPMLNEPSISRKKVPFLGQQTRQLQPRALLVKFFEEILSMSPSER